MSLYGRTDDRIVEVLEDAGITWRHLRYDEFRNRLMDAVTYYHHEATQQREESLRREKGNNNHE